MFFFGNLSAILVKKYTETVPPHRQLFFVNFVPRMKKKRKKKKEIHVVAVSEDRTGIYSAYESLVICQHCCAAIKEVGPLQIACSYIAMAYLSNTPHGCVEAVHLRLMWQEAMTGRVRVRVCVVLIVKRNMAR